MFSFNKTSGDVIVFSRDVKASDLIQMAGGAPGDSSGYTKHEESVFVNKILQKSHGEMKIKLEFGDPIDDDDNDSSNDDDDDSSNDDMDKSFDFGKEFESNGSYFIEQVFCKQRARRSTIFSDSQAPTVKRDILLAEIDLC